MDNSYAAPRCPFRVIKIWSHTNRGQVKGLWMDSQSMQMEIGAARLLDGERWGTWLRDLWQIQLPWLCSIMRLASQVCGVALESPWWNCWQLSARSLFLCCPLFSFHRCSQITQYPGLSPSNNLGVECPAIFSKGQGCFAMGKLGLWNQSSGWFKWTQENS